ncbi:MAG: hypothetical protein ACYCYA_03965 [Actinomycetes bacterium]
MTAQGPDGSLVVRHVEHAGQVCLPAGYVAAHVRLAYATTIHRPQGLSVDTTHVLIGAGLTGVLTGILTHPGVEVSARQMIRERAEQAASLTRLYPAWQKLAGMLLDTQWARVLGTPLAGSVDPAVVLAARVHRLVARCGSTRPRLVAGMWPRVPGDDTPVGRGLTQAARAIQARAGQLARRGVEHHEAWTLGLGLPPADPVRAGTWWAQVATLAAYRDAYQHTGPDPLDPPGPSDPQQAAARLPCAKPNV